MKKSDIISGFILLTAFTLSGCRMGKKDPGKSYMPDMSQSRAYETYDAHDNLAEKGIYYDATPVEGTIARGELPAFPYSMDKAGDTVNYVASKQVLNPLPPLGTADSIEAARLFLVNCGICHGEKLDGNGPLWNNGDGPYPAAPKNLITDPVVSKMPEGQIFYSVTYGKGQMGSYASQLSTKQRWMIIHFVKGKQQAAAAK